MMDERSTKADKESKKDSKKDKKKEKDKKKKKLTKLDIGAPENDFRIVKHVGWDADKGLNVCNCL